MIFITFSFLTLCRKFNSNFFLFRQFCESRHNENIEKYTRPLRQLWSKIAIADVPQGVLKQFSKIHNFVKKWLHHMCFLLIFCKIFIKNHFYRISPDDGFCVGYIFKKYLSFNGLFQENYYY